jgi:hypothetical protein
LRDAFGWPLLFSLETAGVAQLVEHHLAKVDVASSSLVTRSSLVMLYAYLFGTRIHQSALSLALSNDVSLAKICRTPLG